MQRGDPMELNFESLKTDSAQRVDEKNGVISLVIMFTPRVIVFKMSKMADFLYFLRIGHSLGNMFKYTWDMLLGYCRTWYV